MNERIKQLLDQCTDKVLTKPWPLIDTEKFAELIVRECAKIVDIWSDEVPCSEGYDKFTVSKLKEHFGVK